MMLFEFETGARVIKVTAEQVDFAFLRAGTVCRDSDGEGKPMIGVLWDGSGSIIQYPFDWPGFEPVPKAT